LNEAVAQIKSETGKEHVEGVQLDLCDFASIRKFVADFEARNIPLHILINNAGLMMTTKELTACGLETTFVANHLGPFLLTNLLLNKLKASAPSRIVVTASAMENPVKGVGNRNMLTLDNFNFEKIPFDSARAYRFSKLCDVLFTYHLHGLLAGKGVTVNCLEPGFIPETSLARAHPSAARWAMRKLGGFFSANRTLDHGGDCVVDLALNPAITVGGNYYEDLKVAKSSDRSHDKEEQQRLWDYSAQVVGL